MSTLAQIRPMLWKYASSVPYSTSSADDKAAFDAVLNQVCERFLKAGYSDTQVATITAYPDRYGNAFITLPRQLNGIIGSLNQTDDCFGSPLMVRGSWYEFLPNGVGMTACDASNIKLMPGRFTTFQDWNTPMQLRVKLEQTETGTIIFRGKLNGQAVYSTYNTAWREGVKLSYTNATVTTTEYFDEPPYAVIKSVTNGRISLYAVDADGVESLVAIYDPTETVPKYKRYKVPSTTTAVLIGTNTSVPAIQTYTAEEIDRLFGDSGTITVNADGTTDLTVAFAFFMRTVRVVAQAGVAPYVHNFTLDNSTAKPGGMFKVRVELAQSTNPVLNFYDNTTGGTLLVGPLPGDGSNPQYFTVVFEWDGTNWHWTGNEIN